MNHLIPVTIGEIGGQRIPTSNARDLHAFLEVGKDFSNWIKDRIEQYEFVEDARRDHTEAHLFAAMILVPQVLGADRSIDIAAAEEIGAELKVDPATVQDAYQLWHEITHPEQPKF